jgi:Fe-S-cluster-containing dehydrogenase component
MRENKFDLKKWMGFGCEPEAPKSQSGCGGSGGEHDCSCQGEGSIASQGQDGPAPYHAEGHDHGGCSHGEDAHDHAGACGHQAQDVFDRPVGRRKALGLMAGAVAATAGVAHAAVGGSSVEAERKKLEWEEFFKKNYRLMTDDERAETLERMERLAEMKTGVDVQISGQQARPDVLFGYAFNISKCRGYRDCISACLKENNQDRAENMQYIRIFEMEQGSLNVEEGNADYDHEVPKDGNYYIGMQCMQCEKPPCVKVCPVGATWKEPDGIIVIDYDWCIGCRYCEAACPYWARRFNWSEPVVPKEDLNPKQHYLGNRPRTKGVMEKCTFCIGRTREGQQPACVEACPTGARTFGNLLDPNSELRWILANKKVFRMKEDLGTEPKFWYYMD